MTAYVCICGHRAEDHAGLCLERCCEPGCACREYVRDWRVMAWPPPKQGEQIPLLRAPHHAQRETA